MVGHIDLPDFVATAVAVETGGRVAGRQALRLPADWLVGLEDLPGIDRRHGMVRFTRNPTRLRDREGHSLALLGRAHPIVRRAISRVQRLAGAAWDARVSIARADEGALPAVLLTFNAEQRSAVRTEFQRIIAVLLPRSGDPFEINEPGRWLQYCLPDRSLPAGDWWRDRFADWVPNRQPKAAEIAGAAMLRDAARILEQHLRRIEREAGDLQDWLRRRADEICGVSMPLTVDLFGVPPDGPNWRSLSAPLDRLAAFTADANNATARRREANSVIELFRRRGAERAARAALSPPNLHLVGMLMLVPPT
jgi:hypothetical protein